MNGSARWVWVAAAALAIAACGGGGGSGGDSSSAAKSVVVRGPITGFGSIVVNGVHYETEGAEIEIGDQGGHGQDDLAVGQIVSIEGSDDGDGHHHAQHVRYEAELQGAVSSIDVAGNSFVAVGQTVQASDATVFSGIASVADLAVGDRVEVSGSRDDAGVVQASFVKKEGPEAESEVRGTIASLDTGAKTFTIGSLTVDYAGATLSPSTLVLADGIIVEVEGTLGGAVLHATKVKQEDDAFHDGEHHGDEAEVEGVIATVNGDGSFVVDGVTVVTTTSTQYRGGTAADVVAGARVEAEGSIQADGSLQAEKVSFRAQTRGMLEGDVEAVDTTASTITLMGVTLHVGTVTSLCDNRDSHHTFALSDIAAGDHVEVAFSGTTGALEATRITRRDADGDAVVRGPVDSFDAVAGTLSIAGIAVDTAGARFENDEASTTREAFFAALAVGTEVKAKGSYAGGVLSASEAEIEQAEGDDDHGGGDDEGGHG